MDADQYVDEMIETIQERGWCQDEFRNSQGNVCILGASDAVFASHSIIVAREIDALVETGDEALGRIRELILREHGFLSIPTYNDDIAKSAEDVILLLKRSKEVAL